MGGASPENSILGSLLKNRQLLFLAKTLRPARPAGQLSETQLMPPVIVSGGINAVIGAGPADTVPSALFQNLELLL